MADPCDAEFVGRGTRRTHRRLGWKRREPVGTSVQAAVKEPFQSPAYNTPKAPLALTRPGIVKASIRKVMRSKGDGLAHLW